MSQLLKTYLAHVITQKRSISDPEKLNQSIRSANIDLNPHQVDAAIFAFKSPLSRGAIMADEVGLGKTIEAGLVINQLWVEGRNRILILVPASLRTQWQDELEIHFNLKSHVLDGPKLKQLSKAVGKVNPLQEAGIYIASHNFAYKYDIHCKEVIWDLVVIDEAHRLRNVWRKTNKVAKAIRAAIDGRPKLLLTATPLQNNLMELYGLTSFIDENYLGTEYSYRTLFVNPVNRQKKYSSLHELQKRLMGELNKDTGEVSGGILTRTLRNQVKELVKFTKRFCVTEKFEPNSDEMELYNSVSEYLRRPFLASTKATQRNMMELIYRKILASSSFAIAGTLANVANFIGKRLQTEFKTEHTEILALKEKLRDDLGREWRKSLPDINLEKFEKKPDEKENDMLPGFDDIEADEEKLSEEYEESDDLGEDEQFEDDKKKIEEREIDHKFTKEEVIHEMKDVLSYYFLARTISVNQKSQALVRVMDKVFKHANKQKWPEKAVIFTESRRTQDHLEMLLDGLGYNLILFNGSNAGKRAKAILEEWENAFPNEVERGSKSINIRKALVWKFKTIDKAILITTEAGAEGLNLQFANIVINYDLPWNPQRVEQRIGRCHRYGQDLDVVVINFLNGKNYADERVYELLKEKIKLFGNLFNFSDKVLGTEELTNDGYEVREIALGGLGSGLDFEKKILSIYRKCRTTEEIEEAFKQLQLELSEVIEDKIEDAQRKVIQHFDEEVRQKLKIRKLNLHSSLSRYDNTIKRYLDLHFGKQIEYENERLLRVNGKLYAFAIERAERAAGITPINAQADIVRDNFERDKNLKSSWEIRFIHPKDKQRKSLEEYIGSEGQLRIDLVKAKRKTVNNDDEISEYLLISACFKKENGWHQLNPKQAEKLLELDVISENESKNRLHDVIIDFSNINIQKKKDQIGDENENFVVDEIDLLNRFVEESLLKFKQEMELREHEIKELNKKMRASKTTGFHEREEIQNEVDKKQKELFKAQQKYFKSQQLQLMQKDKKVKELRSKLQMDFEVSTIAEAHFMIKN